MRYLSVSEVLEIYSRVMQQTGGLSGVRDLGALESAVAQPRMGFGGTELYPLSLRKPPHSVSRSSKTIPLWTAISGPVTRRWRPSWS